MLVVNESCRVPCPHPHHPEADSEGAVVITARGPVVGGKLSIQSSPYSNSEEKGKD